MRFLTLLLLTLTATCLVAQTTTTKTLLHDGEERTYILYVPANYDGETDVPLLLNYHGYTSSAEAQMGYGDFRSIADTAGFLIVHPQGLKLEGKTHWNVGGWTYQSKVDDVAFTAALLDSLEQAYAIDTDRIYATGMSNGGYMSFLLACELGDRITAVASVTGAMTPQMYAACAPAHPTPVLQVHSTSDPVVPFGGAFWSTPVDTILSFWTEVNDIDAPPVRTALADSDPDDGSTVEHFRYADDDSPVVVEHYRITDGGHTWPGSPFREQKGINRDFDASAVIWDFLSAYRLSDLRKE